MNRRSFTRVPFQADAVVRHRDMEIRGRVKNLSLDGFLLETSEKIPIDEPIQGRLFISNGSTEFLTDFKGTVVRLADNAMGIRFSGMHVDSFVGLRKIIESMLDDEEKMRAELTGRQHG